MWKETCKNPVCTEVWSWNLFVCLKVPQNSLSVSVNVQLHLTADAGDHLTRKLMNLLLGRKKNRCLLSIPWNILHQIWSGVISQSDWSKCVMSVLISSGSNKAVRVPWQYWEQRMATYLEQPFFFKTKKIPLRIDIKQARFREIFQPRKTSFFLFFFPVLLWSVWPVIYLMVLLGSAGVVGVCR